MRKKTYLRLMELQEEQAQRHLAEVRGAYREMRGYKHDFHHHLQTLKGQLEAGQVQRALDYISQLDESLRGLDALLKTGNIVDTEYAYEKVPRELDPFDGNTFDASGVPFWAVVTNVETGQPEYIRLEHAMAQMDVIRASASMPFVSQPVKIGGKLYLDGGVADSIPFRAAEKLGFDRVVVILTRDKSYVKKPMNPKPIDLWYKHYPALAEQLKNRHNVYNNALRELLNWEQQGKAWVLHPSQPIEIGRLERRSDKLQAVYDLGTGDAAASLGSLRTYLAQG